MNWGTPVTHEGHLRPGSHWIFHNHNTLPNLQRPDGNVVGFKGFRRMWAGGSLEFVQRIKPHVKITKVSELQDAVYRAKEDRKSKPGAMYFLHWSENLYNEDG